MSTIARDAELEGRIDFTRQRDWLDPTQLRPGTAQVTMVGVGGIGTPTALLLGKLGIPRINLVDFDEVEAHNLPNQLFPLDSTGQAKTEAMAEVLQAFTVADVRQYAAAITEDGFSADVPELRGIVIAALDSMEARQHLWQKVKRRFGINLFLDARLGGENIVVYAVNPMDADQCQAYEETLYSDEEARPDPCTRRSVIDVGFAVASLLGRAVRKHLAGEDLPFMVFLNQDTLNIYKQE